MKATWWDPDHPRSLLTPIQWVPIQVLWFLNRIGVSIILISWLEICVTLHNIIHMTTHAHTYRYAYGSAMVRSAHLRNFCTVFLTAAHAYACIVWLMPSLYGGIKTGVWPSLFTLLISNIPSSSSNYLTSLDLTGANQTSSSQLDSLRVTRCCFFKQWLNSSTWLYLKYWFKHKIIRNPLWARRFYQPMLLPIDFEFYLQ